MFKSFVDIDSPFRAKCETLVKQVECLRGVRLMVEKFGCLRVRVVK